MKRLPPILRRVLIDPRFALAELLLVVLSGVIWILQPQLGIFFTLVALLPWGLRLLVGEPSFQRTPLDWFLLVLVLTAWVGYWAAYDKTSAWSKVWLIVTAVLLYYALSRQPKQNIGTLSLFSFNLGIAVAIYFFLTHGFTSSQENLTVWWLEHRPQVGWQPIHPGYICGLLVITNLFAQYWLRETSKKSHGRLTLPLTIYIILGMGIVLYAFVLTVSRGVWMAMACGFGVWVIWRVSTSNKFKFRSRLRSLFPLFVVAYLAIILVLTYLGPAQVGGGPEQSDYGINSRVQVFERASYFLLDYPIIGAGLNSFPGLYSEYMLVIPNLYFLNSYNMFLDVAIEQGLIGGLVFLFIYWGTVWLMARTVIVTQSNDMWFFNWLGLFALIFTIVHSFFYDYLYNSHITLLLLFPVGISMIGILDSKDSESSTVPVSAALSKMRKYYVPMVLIFGVVTVLILNRNKMTSTWYSNLGAVRMSQVELKNFPTNQWATAPLVPHLETAEVYLRTALQYNPNNPTANYRLGRIYLLRQNFDLASTYLETAYQQVPGHRGIIKNLGYAYVWLGKMDKAETFLGQIPEAEDELNAYTWWWNTQGRQDLSTNASVLASELKSADAQQ